MTENFRSTPSEKSTPDETVQAHATLQQALAHHQKGQLAQAEALYTSVLKVQPQHFDCLHLLGCLAYQTGRHQMAVELMAKAIEINPRLTTPYLNIGLALQALNRLDEALVRYEAVIALKPDFAEAYNNRGNVLVDLKRLDEALISYEQAIALKPEYAAAYYNRGNVLSELKQLNAALASYEQAIVLKPEYATAYYNRGNALSDLKRLDEAQRSYEQAIALKPDYAEAHNNRGNALRDLKRYDEALASYEQAMMLKPDYAEAHNNYGNALRDLKRYDEALASYERAIALNPNCELLLGALLLTKMMMCDWQDLEKNIKACEAGVRAFKKVTRPFPLLSLLDSPELQQQAATIWADAKFPRVEHLGAIKKRMRGERVRVGYYSADFRNHPVAYLTAELFESHDRQRYEIYGFSFGTNTNDEMRRRVSSAFDTFFDVGNMSDTAVAKLSRELGIDIAVDLGGYTENSRTGIFAMGCAPVQVNYLGYPGTMGTDYIDYVIADKTVIPVEGQTYFTEKIVYLPHSFQVNDSKRKISDRRFTKQELNLPEIGFVFCCFNNTYKITPSTFDVWMRILGAVEGSVLWLLEDNPAAVENLRKEAESRGLNGGRLVFAKRMAYSDYLARYRWADLFLDTLPYNAGTTASDALWAGLPVLTCTGRSFASRMAASLLKAVELPELIATTEAEYEAVAVELASNSEKLAEIKLKLERNRISAPLFNAKLFARHLELSYEAMYDRYQAGLAPQNIDVSEA